MSLQLGFHGAARTVTGSRYRLDSDGFRTVIDAGLFQGYKSLRQLNWRDLPYPAASVDQVILTHAHIDHIGLLPRMVDNGFHGRVYATSASIKLATLLLLDSARIHEEDAHYANRKGFSRHRPAKPLYTSASAQRAIELMTPVKFSKWLDSGGNLKIRWQPTGHILGSAAVEIHCHNETQRRILFSGDIGRYQMPLHIDPVKRADCDFLICESTYGNRDHDRTIPLASQLKEIVARTIQRKGIVLIPAFAVGRSQQMILLLRQLMNQGELTEVPIHLDSPMAVNATDIYSQHLDQHHLDKEAFADGRDVLFPKLVQLHKTREESIALNDLRGPRIIISASGMLTGGRVLHHLARLVSKSKNTIIMSGYQAPGSRGRDLLEGKPEIKIHGKARPVNAEIATISGLSAHADRGELLRWIKSNKNLPEKIFLTHGEPEAAFAFAREVHRETGCEVIVPNLDDQFELS